MDRPTVTEIRAWSPPQFNFTRYGFPTVDPPEDDPLDVRVGFAVGTLYAVTGRTMASITSDEETSIAQKVIVALLIFEVLGGSEAALKVLEAPWLKSFTAGSYSETRFSPSEIMGSGSSKAPPYPPALWALLWALMTPEKRDEWLFLLTGQHAPAIARSEPHFGGHEPTFGPLIWGPGIDTWPG